MKFHENQRKSRRNLEKMNLNVFSISNVENAKRFDEILLKSNSEVSAVQKHVNLVDLVKRFPTNIY